MALIKCPECGGQVSDSATICPHCGFSLADLEKCCECNHIITRKDASCPECGHPTPWSRICPGCGNNVLPSEETCPECGFDMISHFGHTNIVTPTEPKIADQAESPEWEDFEEKPSKKKRYIIGSVLLLGAIMSGWWFWQKSPYSNSNCIQLNAEENYEREFDGLYEWSVSVSNGTDRYKEEIGCEISDGKVVNATWYGSHANSPLSAELDGNTLTLRGQNALYSDIWIECIIDLRTDRGTIASPLVPTTNVRFERLNTPTTSNTSFRRTNSNPNSGESLRINHLLDKLDSNIAIFESLVKRYRNGENVELELNAYMKKDDSAEIINEINSYSGNISNEQRERLNSLVQKYQSLL